MVLLTQTQCCFTLLIFFNFKFSLGPFIRQSGYHAIHVPWSFMVTTAEKLPLGGLIRARVNGLALNFSLLFTPSVLDRDKREMEMNQ